MSVAASAGAAAWVVPEILTAKPAAGATLSGNSHTSSGGSTTDPATSPATTGGPSSATSGTSSPATSPAPSALAFTGLNIQRDAEIGAALIAGGWAMHHWASRTPKLANETATTTEAHEAGSQVDPT
jgi:hypothetical protein